MKKKRKTTIQSRLRKNTLSSELPSETMFAALLVGQVALLMVPAASSVLVEVLWIDGIHECADSSSATALQCEQHAISEGNLEYSEETLYDRPLGCYR